MSRVKYVIEYILKMNAKLLFFSECGYKFV